ncbi:MAG: hypothetical protein OQL19_16685 [Gammaproteobacteria bacterium]|nr:hypothetical protein [Gammaproteobacteria bacterium]
MNIKKRFLFLLLSLFYSNIIFAAPVINSVDSSELDDGKLTILGSGFGSDAPNVIMYDRFESDSSAASKGVIPTTSPDIGEWSSSDHSSVRAIYNSQAQSGNFSAQVYDATQKVLTLDFDTGAQEVFMSYWVRLPNNQIFPGAGFSGAKIPKVFSTDSSWKFTWLYDLDRSGHSNDLCLPTHVGSEGVFYLAGNDFNLDTSIGNRDVWWSWNSWIRISVWLRANQSDPTANGDVLFQTISAEKGVREYITSKPVFDADFSNGIGEMHEGLPDIKQYQHLSFPGWIRSGSDEGTTPLYDNIYVAIGENSQARVEIADSSNYIGTEQIAIQKVISWSDTKIEIELVDIDSFNSLKDVFIFVSDKDGNRNTTGTSVTVGSDDLKNFIPFLVK